jgi:hypothetical protein
MNAQNKNRSQRRLAQSVAVMLVLVLLLAGCASAAATQAPMMNEGGVGVAQAPSMPQDREAISYDSAGEYAPGSAPAPSVERMVIKNANLTIVVDDPAKAMETIAHMADEMGGFVVSANVYHYTLESGVEVPRASITIRIPAEKLDDGLARIKSESKKEPVSENISSQDVTSDYTDLQSRLRNQENTEAKLTEIMESATKTEDVLTIYNQLAVVREQIEVLKGQIKYYEESAALSAVSVDLLANEAVQPLTIGGWQPVGVAKTAVQALINTLKFLANLVIWIIILVLPVSAVLYFVFYLPIRFAWRKWRKGHPSKKDRKAALQPPAQAG